jgi:hypothetical protein
MKYSVASLVDVDSREVAATIMLSRLDIPNVLPMTRNNISAVAITPSMYQERMVAQQQLNWARGKKQNLFIAAQVHQLFDKDILFN